MKRCTIGEITKLNNIIEQTLRLYDKKVNMYDCGLNIHESLLKGLVWLNKIYYQLFLAGDDFKKRVGKKK